MREIEVEIEGKKFKLRELSYIQALELDGMTKAEMAKKLFTVCAGLTEEQMSNLTLAEGTKLQQEINEINNPLQVKNA